MRTSQRLRPRLIETEDDIRAGVRALRRKCRAVRMMHDAAGDPPLRRRPGGFEGLARIIVAQQVSVASAAAIWERTAAAVSPFEPAHFLTVPETALRTAGLSGGKVRTLAAIATAVAKDGLDLDALAGESDDTVTATLTSLHGVGPWTADIFLLFCLGRADAFAPGDLALQVAAGRAFELAERPDKLGLLELAERWRPWRGVAARLLWAYYRVIRQMKSGAPV